VLGIVVDKDMGLLDVCLMGLLLCSTLDMEETNIDGIGLG